MLLESSGRDVYIRRLTYINGSNYLEMGSCLRVHPPFHAAKGAFQPAVDGHGGHDNKRPIVPAAPIQHAC
jgi:hypothetical protein